MTDFETVLQELVDPSDGSVDREAWAALDRIQELQANLEAEVEGLYLRLAAAENERDRLRATKCPMCGWPVERTPLRTYEQRWHG